MRALMTAVMIAACGSSALAIDEAHEKKADEMIAKAVSYLRAQQQEDGSWTVNARGAKMPAVTGLVINGMLLDPSIDATDETVKRAIDALIAAQQPDGGIYELILPNYNTSIAVSALAQADTAQAKAATDRAVEFLRSLQWWEGAPADGEGADRAVRVDKSNPYYGGVGYGRHSRPDLSNVGFFVQAMHDAGVEAEDPAMQRAIVFIQRVQLDDRVNDLPYAKGVHDGGFVYSTGRDPDTAGQGDSEAGSHEETLDDGSTVSRLRTYGSMTYTGFKSYIYAHLNHDDERVQLALDWIKRHYTLEENPGIGDAGLYYYFVTFARALNAWGEETIEIATEGGTEQRDWANDLIDRLAALQNEDGSFKSVSERWMESNPVLITAYSLIALQEARN